MSRQRTAQRAAPLSLVLFGAVILLVVLATQRSGSSPRSTTQSGTPVGASGGAVTSSPSASGSGAGAASAGVTGPRALPSGLDDRGWIAEVGVQRWLAGSLSGRILVLPSDEIGLTATASQVVSVRYTNGGKASNVRVRDLAAGRLRVSVDRPGTISSAVVTGDSVYVTGDAGTGGGADAGVQAISLADGSVRDVIPAGPAPADAVGPVTRTQLRLDAGGGILGSPLCTGDTCSVDLVDLASGTRTTPVRNAHGFLVAFTNRVIYLVDDTSTSLDALDAITGEERWHLADVQLSGLLPTSDGARVVLSYLPSARNGTPAFTLASADAATGSLKILLQRATDTDAPTFYPNLSNDRFAVIGSGGTLGELLGGARRRAALTLVDARSGSALADAVTLAAP